MPNLVALSQATAKINRGGGIRPPQALSVSNHPGQIGLTPLIYFNNFDSCLEYEIVSYTMVHTPCFEEIYSNIRNQSGCFCEMSS